MSIPVFHDLHCVLRSCNDVILMSSCEVFVGDNPNPEVLSLFWVVVRQTFHDNHLILHRIPTYLATLASSNEIF